MKKMKIFTITNCILMCLTIFSQSVYSSNPFSYDYSATTKCLEEPQEGDYGGGLILNHEFNHGLKHWTLFGKAKTREAISDTDNNNRFIVVYNRTDSLDSLSQKIQVEDRKMYSFSAWVRIGKGSDETIRVVFRTGNDTKIAGGEVLAKEGCWSLLRGGFTALFSGHVDILLQSQSATVDIWMDNVSVQEFTKSQWRFHQNNIINKIRKSKVRFNITYANENAVKDAIISIKEIKPAFGFGCGINHHILESKGYRDWFAKRFKDTSFTNEMKWYSTEILRGRENYTISDSMLEFSQKHGISVRGHNILWANPKMQPNWVKTLTSPEEIQKAAVRRVNSVVKRYRGKLSGWDVMNEPLHFRFYEDKLGDNATEMFYSMTYKLDPNATMFLNEYNTIEESTDKNAGPVNFKKRLEKIMNFPGNAGMKAGIGLQGHFPGRPNIPYMRSSLDILGAMGLPVWLTEVDLGKSPKEAEDLEEVLREAFSHPSVEGIIIFGGPKVANFTNMNLVDEDFKNTPTGDVVDNLIKEWKTKNQIITKDGEKIDMFHGDYSVVVTYPNNTFSTSFGFKVTREVPEQTVDVHIGGGPLN